jgi:hypothetical protein
MTKAVLFLFAVICLAFFFFEKACAEPQCDDGCALYMSVGWARNSAGHALARR